MSKYNILITGASSGFGWGVTQALAQKGHHLVATMRGVNGKNEDKAAELRAWAQKNGASLDVVEIDVTQDSSVAAGVKAAIAKVGRIDVLINNAGVGTWGPQEAFSSEQTLNLFNINVVGTLRMNQAVAPHMRENGGGYIIYLSSGLGRIQLPFLGPYSATKHAVESIAEIGSIEMGPMGIETTILQPGAYGTSFLTNSVMPANQHLLDDQPPVKALYDAFAGSFEERAAAGDLADPQEVVDALVGLVEMDKGSRPLRRTVGADVEHGVGAINEACANVQNYLATMFGYK